MKTIGKVVLAGTLMLAAGQSAVEARSVKTPDSALRTSFQNRYNALDRALINRDYARFGAMHTLDFRSIYLEADPIMLEEFLLEENADRERALWFRRATRVEKVEREGNRAQVWAKARFEIKARGIDGKTHVTRRDLRLRDTWTWNGKTWQRAKGETIGLRRFVAGVDVTAAG